MKPLVSQLWPQFMADPDFAAAFGRVIVDCAQMFRADKKIVFTLQSAAPLDPGLCSRLLASLEPEFPGFEFPKRVRRGDHPPERIVGHPVDMPLRIREHRAVPKWIISKGILRIRWTGSGSQPIHRIIGKAPHPPDGV